MALQITTSAILPGSSEPVLSATPAALAGFRVIQAIASAGVMLRPIRLPAPMAMPASWFRCWVMIGSSEWMITQAPPRCARAALASMPSRLSILKPAQSAQVSMQMPSLASRGAIL